ncbi:uncharacterized protein LOC143231917 isoform X1 [Tachypleus tridentatus]|uniref:uncharacterized protein LOC143231917 isoform X1 n=1 Tax=Tachypleus tridentatus TaxID=6853 RepID=UPI003FD1E25B
MNPVPTTYTLKSHVISGHSLLGYGNCPNTTKVNNTCCQWRVDTSPPYYMNQKQLWFTLTGHNHLGHITQNIMVDHYKFVLPDEPSQLQASGETTTSIKMNWLPPKNFAIWDFPPGLVYELLYKPNTSKNESWKIIKIGKNIGAHNLTGLVPNTVYDLSVRCRSAEASGEDMWSNLKSTLARTAPDVPYHVPNITEGSFEVKELSGSRNITLYWKPIPEEHYNGKDFHYVISYKPTYSLYYKRDVSEQTVEVMDIKYTFSNLNINTAYKFKIRSANKEGVSRGMEDLTVESTENMPAEPEEVTVMSFGNGTYQVNWEYPKDKKNLIDRFTIYWCHNLRPHSSMCRYPIEWTFVPPHNTSENINLSGDTNYQFAVSAETRNISSGMNRASCVVPYEKALDKVQGVDLYKIFQGLQVRWRLACSAQKKLVTQYKVEYCEVKDRQQTCSDPFSVTTDNQSASRIDIKDLKPFTLYRVTVQVISTAGISDFSDPKYEKTFAGTPSVPREVKVVDINSSAIQLTWKVPATPNGVISHYFVYYRNFSEKVISVPAKKSYSTVLWRDVRSYTNYSIFIKACNDKLCSSPSETVFGMTLIDAPGVMMEPYVEVINSSAVHVRWSPPDHPNGPINFYLLSVKWEEENGTSPALFNTSGTQTFIEILLNCPVKMEGLNVYFSIQAANIKGYVNLLGPSSPSIKTKLCFHEGLQVSLILGIALGGSLGLVVVVLVFYALVCWMMKKINLMKQIRVQLPNGLDAPNTEPNFGYDKFIKRDDERDHNIGLKVPVNIFDLYSSNNNNNLIEGQSSNISQCLSSSTDELVQRKILCSTYRRNPSGDSSGYSSVGGCDSFSSSFTNHTHLSSEYHTDPEFNGPVTPDAVFMDYHLESDHFLIPCQGKLALPTVDELQDTEELYNENNLEDNRRVPDPQDRHPYCSLDIMGRATHKCVPFDGQQNSLPLFTRNLSNSEPSVFDIYDDHVVCVTNQNYAVPPYSRLGLAKRSDSTVGSNMPQIQDQFQNLTSKTGYSKFGVINILGNSTKQTSSLKDSKNTVGMSLPASNSDIELKPDTLRKTPSKWYVVAKPDGTKPIRSSSPTVVPSREPILGLPTKVPKSGGYVSLPSALKMFKEPLGYSKFGIESNLDNIKQLEMSQEKTPPQNSCTSCENMSVVVDETAIEELDRITKISEEIKSQEENKDIVPILIDHF